MAVLRHKKRYPEVADIKCTAEEAKVILNGAYGKNWIKLEGSPKPEIQKTKEKKEDKKE